MNDLAWFEESTNVRVEIPTPIGAAFRVVQAVSTKAAANLAFELCFRPPRGRLSASAQDFLATGSAVDVPLDGAFVRTWSWAPIEHPHRGTALVLHGWGGAAAQMRTVVRALLASGLRVVALDAPGHGQSPGATSSIVRFAEAVAAVARELGPPDVLVAHSLGCAAATLAVHDGAIAPDHIAFYGPNHHPLGFLGASLHALGASIDTARAFASVVEDRTGRRFPQVDPRPMFPEMRGDLLVVHALDDREIPVGQGVDLATAWPRARLLTLPSLGHRRILHDPGIADRVATFLGGAAVGRRAACSGCGRPTAALDGLCELCSLETSLFHRDARA